MSSIAPPPPASTTPKGSDTARIRSDELIEARIAEACNALWWAELVRAVLGMVVFSIAVLLIWVVIDQWIYSPGRLIRLAASIGLLALLGVHVYRRLRPLIGGSIRPEYAARSLERDMPELRQALTSYVTLRGDREAGDLRSRVVKSIGATTAGRLRGHDALPQEATGTMRWWVATACALAVLVAYAAFSPKNTLQSAARLAIPTAAIDPPRRVSIREVQPGDADAIAGRSVEISAAIDGLRNGEQAVCNWQLPSGQQEFALIDDPDSRRNTGTLALPHSASGIVRYTISAGDATAGPFQLTVQDVPVVALEAVQYSPPAYTGQRPYSSSSGAITAVDGTAVKILANTNRPVAKAKIEFNPRVLGNRVQATAGATEMEIDAAGTGLTVSFPLRSARGRSAAVELEDYRILVWDASGQGNPDPIVYPIRVVPDLPPEVAITVPASSPKEVPIDSQQIIEVHASDPDFGLKSITLEIRAGIDLIEQPILWSSESGEKGHRVAEFPLRPTDLELRIGDTVQVVAIASDNRSSEFDPKVEPNIVRTDPVTLKITASGPMPGENDPNADGLTSPEERSAESDSSSGGESGDSGKQQSGGGGSGSGSQQQSGGEGEGSSGGEQEGNESSEDSSGSGGAGESKSTSSDPNQSDQPGSPDGANGSQGSGGQKESSDSQAPDSQSGTDPASGTDSQSGTDPAPGTGGSRDDAGAAGGQDSPGQSGQPQDAAASDPAGTGGANQDPGQANEANQDAGSSGGQQQNQPGTGKGATGADASGQDSTGGESSSEGQSDPNQPRAAESGQGTEQSGSQAGAEGEQGSEPKRAPEHDGEAFERIQEYLEKNRPEGAERSQASGQESDSSQDQPDGSSDQSAPRQQQDAGQKQQGAGQEQQGSQGSQSDASEASGQGAKSEGAEDSAAGQESGGDQSPTAGDSPQSKADGSGRPQQSSQSEDTSPGQSGKQDASAESSDQGAGESKSVPEESGEQAGEQAGEQEGSGGQGKEQASGRDPAGDSTSAESDSSQGSSSSNSSQTASPKGGEPGSSKASAQGSSAGVGEGGDQGDLAEQPPPPPDPVNAEYAKKATDLVLDYLEQTREAPDPKLLDELKWSEEDLQRFTERWQQVRGMTEQPGAGGNRDVEEALKSLGLRPQGGEASTTRESADALKGIRDSGNRKPPPAAFRDAFDAFRRAVGKQ